MTTRPRPWWRIGWRNVGRNRRRSLFTVGGLGLAYCAVVVMTGLARGMVAEMIGNGTDTLSGQIQVHARNYLPERSIYETVGGSGGTDVGALIAALEDDPDVEAAAPRVYGGGLVSAGDATVAAELIGIDPSREPAVAAITATGIAGALPSAGANELWIGREMARQLEVGVGDEIVVVAPAADGSLGNDLFTVSGVFRSGLADLDARVAFVPLDAVQRLLVLDRSRVHEVAMRVDDPWRAPAAAVRLSGELGDRFGDLRIRAWTEFRPEMVEYAALFESVEWVLILVVFVMAVFGVANTMLMATFERRREFALLLALGVTPFGILRAVLWEAVALGGMSLVAGAAVTLPILVWWHRAPPDMSWLYGDFTMAGGLVRPILRVEYPPATLLTAALALFATAVIAALLPAIRAGRVPPADTLQGR